MANNNGLVECGYPWRQPSNGSLGQQNYEAEEESFRDTKETTEKPCIWQVYNSQVTEVKESEFFKFYDNRAYIILAMEEKDPTRPEGFRNLHIWVSKFCSREDYELAVARADQLSKMLRNPKPAVHREIQHFETDAFHNHDRILEVRRGELDPPKRLLQFHSEDTVHRLNKKTSFPKSPTRQISFEEPSKSSRLKKQWMIERELLRGNLISGDVFVLTNLGDFEIFQWNGQKSNPEEREIAKKFIEEEQRKFRNEKKLRANHIVIHEGNFDKNHKFYTLFPHTATKRRTSVNSENKAKIGMKFKNFYCLTDDNGHFLDSALHEPWNKSKSNLLSKHVYLIDTDYHVFVWVGDEWKDAFVNNEGKLPPLMVFYESADRFLQATYGSIKEEEVEDMFHLPGNKPITLVNEDDYCMPLDKALSGH